MTSIGKSGCSGFSLGPCAAQLNAALWGDDVGRLCELAGFAADQTGARKTICRVVSQMTQRVIRSLPVTGMQVQDLTLITARRSAGERARTVIMGRPEFEHVSTSRHVARAHCRRHDLLDFLYRRHRSVTGRRHRQRPVCRAVIHRLLRITGLQKTINQPARETVLRRPRDRESPVPDTSGSHKTSRPSNKPRSSRSSSP